MAHGAGGNNGNASFIQLLTAILGAITGVAALIYALGLVIIFSSLYGKYIDSVSTAWYAASLVPNRLVAVYGLRGLLWPAAPNVLFTLVLLFILVPLLTWLIDEALAQLIPQGGWLATIGRFLIVFPLVIVPLALLVYLCFVYLPVRDLIRGSEASAMNRIGIDEVKDLVTCAGSHTNRFGDSLANHLLACEDPLFVFFWIYFGLTVLGCIAGIVLIYYAWETATQDDDKRRPLLWGISVIFVASYLGAIVLAIPRQPPLPYVALVERQGNQSSALELQEAWWHVNPIRTDRCTLPGSTKDPEAIEGILLAYYERHWYVLDKTRGDISVIPDNQKGLVSVPSAVPKRCIARVIAPTQPTRLQLPKQEDTEKCPGASSG